MPFIKSYHRKCFVRGCNGNKKDNPNLRFFKLPQEPEEKRRKWLKFADNKLLKNSKQVVFFCDVHFDQEAYASTSKTGRINRYGIPTLNPPPHYVPTVSEQLPEDTLPRHDKMSENECNNTSSSHEQFINDLTDVQITDSESSSEQLSVTPICSTGTQEIVIQNKNECGEVSNSMGSYEQYENTLNDIHVTTTIINEHSYSITKKKKIMSTPMKRYEKKLLSSPKKGKRNSLTLSEIDLTRTCQLTPREKFMYKYGRAVTKKLDILQKKYKKQQINLKLLNRPDYRIVTNVDNLSKKMSTASAIFFAGQFRNSLRSSRGRRWTIPEKIQSLTLFKKSPKCYILLSSMFCLPSPRTLISLLNSVPFTCGINDHIFSNLKQSMQDKRNITKMCILMFDEIAIREHVSYNARLDRIEGFEDHGTVERSCVIANRALVFMVRGMFQKWKQPVAYFFCRSCMTSGILARIIRAVIDACQNAGLVILGTVCDMGTSNTKALKIMGSSKTNPYVDCAGIRVYTLFDTPHLLKCTRNLCQIHELHYNMVTHDNLHIQGRAKWKHIEETYKRETGHPFQLLHKITSKHLDPKGREKMKVKLAAQIFSHTVSGVMYHLYNLDPIKFEEILKTAFFVDFMDQLFDSLNSAKNSYCRGKLLTNCVTATSVHFKFWVRAYKNICTWQFYDKENKPVRRPPSVDGWLTTLRGIILLWKDLQEKNIKFLWTRNLNQDPLENLFGEVRFQCGCNHNPTTTQFSDSLKTCIINGLACRGLMKNSNCAADDTEFLSDLHHFLTSKSPVENSRKEIGNIPEVENEDIGMDTEDIPEAVVNMEKDMSPFNELVCTSTGYVAGFIARRVLEKVDCATCDAALLLPEEEKHDARMLGIVYQEYSCGEQCLTYPSGRLHESVQNGSDDIENVLNSHAHKNNIMEKLKSRLMEKQYFSWISENCGTHGQTHLIKVIHLLCKTCIYWWCKRKNRSFKLVKF